VIDVFFGRAARLMAQLLVSFHVPHRQVEKIAREHYAQEKLSRRPPDIDSLVLCRFH